MSYTAIVTRINTRKHPNADRLQLGLCYGFQVIVSLDTRDGELGVFFPCDGQLSDEFCTLNDLYPRYDEKGNRIGGGFIDPKNRRVKAQTFRGEKSYGFYVPLSYFDHYGVTADWFVEGKEFVDINGRQICNKYETQQTRNKQQKQFEHRQETIMFPMHFDTKQFLREIDDVNLSKVENIIITEKLHGTSFRIGRVLDNRKLNWFERLLLKLRVKIQTQDWTILNGSRRVILEKSDSSAGYYGTDDFRYTATYKLQNRLHKGEVVFGEIVGYVAENSPIMPTVKTTAVQDKSFQKQYGKEMTFVYGCKPGIADIYIYRIAHINEDGIEYELSWNQVKARCLELGVKYVPELYQVDTPVYTETLTGIVNDFTQGSSTIDSSHIKEGVCIRFEYTDDRIQILKNKSFEFYVLEGVLKDEGVEDIEESN